MKKKLVHFAPGGKLVRNRLFNIRLGGSYDIENVAKTFYTLDNPLTLENDLKACFKGYGINAVKVPREASAFMRKTGQGCHIVVYPPSFHEWYECNQRALNYVATILKNTVPQCEIVPIFFDFTYEYCHLRRWRYDVIVYLPTKYVHPKL